MPAGAAPIYDKVTHERGQVVLKKRSCGPTIGTPSPRSFQLFYMASFRDFLANEGFSPAFNQT